MKKRGNSRKRAHSSLEMKIGFFWGDSCEYSGKSSLQLNDVANGLWNGRRYQLFLETWIVGLKGFPELMCYLDDKGACAFEQ